MKKFLIIFFAVLFAFELNMLSYAKKQEKKPITKHKIEFTTKDKFILSGDLYIANPATNKPLVVALHSFGMNAQAWKEIAENLRQKGYNVLAMDLRGHGRSVFNEQLKLKSRYGFKAKDWQKLPNDVNESIAYIKTNYPKINCNDLIFIGADIGASAEILAGDLVKKYPKKFVIISPMLNFKGLYIPIKITKYTNTKFLVLLSKTDRILFNFYSITPPTIKTYPLGGQGNMLLKANPTSVDEIIKFIIN